MTHVPAEDLATEIGTQVGSLTLGTNLFHSTIRGVTTGVPENAVFVWGDSGLPALRAMSDSDEIRKPLVIVQVRNKKYGNGSALAYSILNALRGLDISTYLDLVPANSDPRAIGQDVDGNHHFQLIYMLVYQEP